MKRLTRLAVVAGVIGAGLAYVWRFLAEPDEPRAERAGAAATGGAIPDRNGAKGNGGGGPTKAELYDEAKRLGVEGRSGMSKAELERAVRNAR